MAFFSWIVCVVIAVLLAKHVAKLVNGIYNFSGLIGNKIAAGLNGNGEFFSKPINQLGVENKQQLIAAIPANTNGMLAQLIKVVINNAKIDFASCTSTVASIVGLGLGNIIMVVVCGVLLFVVLKLIVFALTKLFNKITDVKVIGILNKILGAVFGVLKAAVVIFVFNFIVVFSITFAGKHCGGTRYL